MIIKKEDLESLENSVPNIPWPNPPVDTPRIDAYYLELDLAVFKWLHQQFEVEKPA